MNFNSDNAAVVIIDPQNDVLTPKGTVWEAVGASVTENNTVGNLERVLKAAKDKGIGVFVSPHYFYPTDSGWKLNGPVEAGEIEAGTFSRRGQLTLQDFQGSGADWVESLKPYIEDGRTVVVSPHKVFGPQTNDLVLQLRKRGLQKILLCGMIANLCVESHLRDFLEQGFEVTVISDATAGPRHPEWGDGYKAAMVNYRFLAHSVLPTDEVVRLLG
ncbi:cysteine hydrolase [Paraburkholderia phytofirmans]|uniref:Isochorismatase hydrolase n=1 Tax=Paraburkholderia phytofirmans (strain DSM 17436 / LMG 22146 / PsJN) TaxID=398527 RepID=B2T1G0_PARPJ|nr:cysteine hydrolase [Paraburkholderia phytofirmans]ACD15517.1 isochorismatase hydrolase [Paraburkholderia phytofirmans PsJN]